MNDQVISFEPGTSFTVGSIDDVSVKKYNIGNEFFTSDSLAIEEPLEIRLAFKESSEKILRNISVTMRTPGHDNELAVGFLFTEGIINDQSDIESVISLACGDGQSNTITVHLKDHAQPAFNGIERNFYTTSSCGVCGKTSIQSIKTVSKFDSPLLEKIKISREAIYNLPVLLRKYQLVFSTTGGLHASALFNMQGEFLYLREDVGRHNALDKLIGKAISEASLPLNEHILLLSGRASFELIQKAAMAGIRFVVAIGAPSSLAVKLAKEFNITLIGFLRNKSFNLYNGELQLN
ncbi:formate dehydrogenase accessory sulfurtransferase FdhD [Pedobacter agri]|uniref:formate dehydrogenase accessory sulfurtransferase FdhD n=2 Tax=Pedobacter TaxID=84567 RepID=UPI00292DE705|nr:formate dehydrogenase accessory sulfurtransferase FdhD [Pedobacter agri]